MLGIFAVRFALAEELKGADLAWVSDPLDPRRSFCGALAEVVLERLVRWGIFDRAPAGVSDVDRERAKR